MTERQRITWRQALTLEYDQYLNWCFNEYYNKKETLNDLPSPDRVDDELKKIWHRKYWENQASIIYNME